MFEAFKARAEAVSAEVHRFANLPQATGFVLSLLEKEGVSAQPGAQAVWASSAAFAGLDRAKLSQAGVSFEVTRDSAASAKVGISRADWAVADTGSLAQDATKVEERLVSTLPPLHVAFVGAERIVPDLAALLEKLSPQKVGYLALVTGPSRTADIERVLTIGVHGPARLVIAVVDGLPGALS
jgi:L-lactate dehydrogenase complex protein LldG